MASLKFRLFAPLVNLLPEILRIYLMYFLRFREIPNIKTPKTFNEKINWRKIYDRDPLYITLSDKIAVKTYLSKKNLNLVIPKVLWEGDHLPDIKTLDNLPSNYVIKANHASGTNFIVRNNKHLSEKKLLNLQKAWQKIEIQKTFVEWGYSKIPIKFFIEEFIGLQENVPNDYKFFVFDKKMHYVQVDIGRGTTSHKRAFFDRDWILQPFNKEFPAPESSSDFIRPTNFDQMVQSSEEIAPKNGFFRVDLYSDNNHVFFGEITIYPASGYDPFIPSKYDKIVGELWSVN